MRPGTVNTRHEGDPNPHRVFFQAPVQTEVGARSVTFRRMVVWQRNETSCRDLSQCVWLIVNQHAKLTDFAFALALQNHDY